ncbi:hypothetical protein [Wielerella bovis]|uniref:hypothetical protein n=1 Tax=Wielerella bovis TaxID=2917790 RepID=UPI002018558D|nr:hypothetical protein [Wielerella bovis]MCG7657855.1 hypothetical protein [Wielerella bovis]MCG7660077.1 hypothetical protein [Wielerella bovis]
MDYTQLTQSPTAPDFTAQVQAELQQVQAALRAGERIITWQIHQPISPEEIGRRIQILKMGNIISTIINLVIIIYATHFVFPNDAELRYIIIGISLLPLIGFGWFVHRYLPKNLHKQAITRTQIMLNADKQIAEIVLPNRTKRSLKWHSSAVLPAFILPHSCSSDLRRLRDEIQHHISQITGLSFE